MTVPVTLTIAGSDSSSGAGIQADLKTFSALESYGCSAVTAITAQNTQGVQEVVLLSPEIIIAQCESIMTDFSVSAIKTGMLGNREIILALAEYFESYDAIPPIILDPVMVSTSGASLLSKDAIDVLKHQLIPKASLITPNLYEAAALLETKLPNSIDEMKALLDDLLDLGSQAVLLKGGHLKEEKCTDLFFDGNEVFCVNTPFVSTKNTHGTGCTLSAAITAYHAKGYSAQNAIIKAKSYVYQSLLHADSLHVGQGYGPVHHFSAWWS